MIRSLAALFAKKTAIVAITGVTVIGGASFALAEVVTTDEPSAEEEVSTEEETPTEAETPTEEETSTEEEPSTEEDGDEAAGEESDEDEGAEEEDESTEDGERRTTLDVKVVDDEVAKDNHGATVSAAAKGGAPCDDLEGNGFKNHGQCVASVASGKKAAVEPTEPAAQDPVISEPENTVEAPPAKDTVEAQTVVAPAEKPNKGNGNAGGNGKGKGGKG